MERPATLRRDLYDTVIASLLLQDRSHLEHSLRGFGYEVPPNSSYSELENIVIESPSQYLYRECDILNHPDLLAGLFIEFDDNELDAGHTYLIDKEAAQEISAGDATILLRSGLAGAVVPRERIALAFANGCVIDFEETERPA